MTPSPTQDLEPASTRQRNRWIAAVVVLALIVAVGLVLVLGGGGNGDDPTGTAKKPVSPGSSTGPSGSSAKPSPKPTPSTGPNPSSHETGAVDPRKPQRVTFAQAAQPAEGVGLSITKVEEIKAKAILPGETSGPALRITMQVKNDKSVSLPIGAAVTNLYYGSDRTPANAVLKPGSKAFPKSVKPGAQATGVVVFRIPANSRDKVTLEVILDNKLRVVEFSGGCPQLC